MIKNLSEKELQKLKTADNLLLEASEDLPLLSPLAWDKSVYLEFEKNQTIPKPKYTKLNTKNAVEKIIEAKKYIDGDSPVHKWLKIISNKLETTAKMQNAIGTHDFYKYSSELFGEPKSLLRDKKSCALDLAKHMDKILNRYKIDDQFELEEELLSAEQLKRKLQKPLIKFFGDDKPSIRIKENLSARATAGTKNISLRKDAKYTYMDVRQLLHHEAYIHIATSLNGKSQEHFKILGSGHAGTTKTQEGLAVMAEMMASAMDPIRMNRLSDRVIAIQMVIDGADFIQLYRFYLERSQNEAEAFESTRRIFRGGVLTGGAPFTKDGVYLEGLIRVDNYIRSSISTNNPKYIKLLFSGKLNIFDMDALMMLDEQSLLTEPKYLPPWIKDMRHLICELTYSSFTSKMNMDKIQSGYDRIFKNEAN